MAHNPDSVPLRYGSAFFIDMLLVWYMTSCLCDLSVYKDALLVVPVGVIYFGILGKKTIGSLIFLRGD